MVEALRHIHATLPEGVTLVCVSKYQPVEAIRAAYEAGERDFGESKVQELQRKVKELPKDIHWHFIGHLQTNKVRDLLRLRPYLIQSVDSERLLKVINDEAAKQGIVQDVLLEVHVAKEESKTGLTPEELKDLRLKIEDGRWKNVRVRGLMTMATNTEDEKEIKRCFGEAKALMDNMKTEGEPILSMGMSDDYGLAIECGSTMVRIGSAIFGERDYSPRVEQRAFFFDMDGVLFDSMPTHAAAWGEVMRAHGWPCTASDVYINEGRTGRSVIHETVLKYAHREPTEEEIQQIYDEKKAAFVRMGGAKPMKDVEKVLKLLKDRGDAIWVVTGSGQKTLLNQLNDHFPDVFTRERMVTAFDVTHGKPNPEPYLKAWEGSGLSKSQCVVVENAPLGVRAGKAAGLYTIAVNTGILPDELLIDEGADRVFGNMQALYEWLKENKGFTV